MRKGKKHICLDVPNTTGIRKNAHKHLKKMNPKKKNQNKFSNPQKIKQSNTKPETEKIQQKQEKSSEALTSLHAVKKLCGRGAASIE